MLRDLGLTRADLRNLADAGPGANELLREMMSVLHLDVAEVERAQPAVLRDLERVCALCDGRDRCRAELSEGTAARDWQEFCPNAVTLQALIEERACPQAGP